MSRHAVMSDHDDTSADAVAAVVDGRPITVGEVDARLAAVRATPAGVRLPSAETAEGRNARRWMVQLLSAERLVVQELADRGINSTGRRALQLGAAVRMGGVAAAMLAAVPGAVDLAAHLADPVTDVEVRDYYVRNLDCYEDGATSLQQAWAAIEAELRDARAETAFALWLDAAMRDRVRTAEGFDHPASPWSKDATHRH